MHDIETLKVIASGRYKDWIKVQKWKESSNVKITEDDYFDLLEHHELETKFLIKLCQNLAKELIKYKSMDGYTC